MIEQPTDLRTLAGRALAAGLSVAALFAIVALLSGEFGETELRVVGTSLGFSVFSSTAAAGAGLRLRRPGGWTEVLGGLAIAVSGLAFASLVLALWLDYESDSVDGLWRAFGVFGLLSLWLSHASLMLAARRAADSEAIQILTATSIVTLAIDSGVGVLAVLGALDDVDFDLPGRLLAALVVVAVLSTVLAALLRRLASAGGPEAESSLGSQLADVADRLEAIGVPLAAQAELERLRRLAAQADDQPARRG